ncbi:hypothetical protein CU097_005284 [Rhizopus azygosporus]|uniref:RRM domain-containing protein n=1 Tax=Rhizopus azygosporus TaxID=86630 RepID=A0A367IU86_RHIAZ|nr:hypothetical protein CU097_005284 [Rhizopus azygosporus]
MSDRSYSPTRGRSYSTRSSSPHSYYSHSRSGSRGRSYSRGRHSRSYSSRRHSRSYSGRSPSPDYYRGKGYYHSRSPSPRYRSQSPRGGHEGRPDCTVFVGNLSYDTNWYDLKDFMRDAGQVVHVDIMKLSNGKSKGCG